MKYLRDIFWLPIWQQSGETLVEYINVLKLLAKDYQFKPVTAEIYRHELIRDAFINGIQSQHIRQRLLENITLTLEAAFTQARSLELAQKSSDSYNTAHILLNAASNANSVHALIDTGSSESYISSQLAKQICLKIHYVKSSVSMAQSSTSVDVIGYVNVTVCLQGNMCGNTKLLVLENLCTEVILRQNILSQHKQIIVEFGGNRPPLSVPSVHGLTTLCIPPPKLFANLGPYCKPIATKSR